METPLHKYIYGQTDWDEAYAETHLPADLLERLNKGSWDMIDAEHPSLPPLKASWDAVGAYKVSERQVIQYASIYDGLGYGRRMLYDPATKEHWIDYIG